MRIVVKDGAIISSSPGSIHGYVDIPLNSWAKDWPIT
jgi:hypothetical protein